MIDVLVAGAGEDGLSRGIEGAVRAALVARDIEHAEVSVALVDDESIRALNRDHLGHDRVTDVIAFPLWTEGDERVVGDVYIGLDQARRQAADEQVDWREETLRLAIHGTLHVAGMDHPEEADQRPGCPMYLLQERLLREQFPAPGDSTPG